MSLLEETLPLKAAKASIKNFVSKMETELTTKDDQGSNKGNDNDIENGSSKKSKKDKDFGKKNRRQLRKKNNNKFKSKKNKYGTTLRHVDALLSEVTIIEEACAGKKIKKEQELDPFQQAKKELNDKLIEIKAAIKTQQNVQNRVGNNSTAISIKNQIKNDLEEAKQLHAQMEEAYKNDKYRTDNDRDGALDFEAIKERGELVELMKQDLVYTENGYKPKSDQGRGYSIAKQARDRRKKMREAGKMSAEPQPLTHAQQQFIQMSIERDAIIDEKLDIIKQGVQQINQIAHDVNNELKKQEIIIDEATQKMDDVTDKIQQRNKQLQDLLDQSGGCQRWCPLVILIVILLAVIGWIWQILSNQNKK